MKKNVYLQPTYLYKRPHLGTINLTRKILLTSFLLFGLLKNLAQVSDSQYFHQLPDFPFVVVSDDYITTAPQISDSLFDAAAQGIRFRVNSSELQPTDPFITIYREKLVPWLKSQDMELRQVYVRGVASHDGPYQNNVRLSRERTNRLIELLGSELGQTLDAAHAVDAQSITEDYGRLVKMMRQRGDADYDKVNRVWLDCKGDEACCKQQLMALEGGKVWQKLKRNYFAALREARVVLWFARKADSPLRPKPVSADSLAKEPQPDTVAVPSVEPVVIEMERPDTVYVRRHLIAIRTNLLHDLLYVPQFGLAWGGNVQLEYYPLHGHYTMNAGFTFMSHRHWSKHKFFQMRDLQLELHRYFKGEGAFIGPYVGVYAEGNKYGIGFSKTKGWEGEGGGGGLSVGYTCRLNRKGNWRLELSASLGLYYTRYDPYVYGNPLINEEDGLYYYDYLGNTSDFRERNHQLTWLGPTNAGIYRSIA